MLVLANIVISTKPNVAAQLRALAQEANTRKDARSTPLLTPSKDLINLRKFSDPVMQKKGAIAFNIPSQSDINESKKRDALAKFQELNKRFAALKKMLGGDPKFLAKALNALAKELKSILRQYKDAIGEIKSQAPTPAIKNAASQDVRAANDETKNIEDKIGDGNIETSPPREIENQQANDEPEIPALPRETAKELNKAQETTSPIAAYARSLLTNEHRDFMRGVRIMIDELKHYMGLSKAQIRFVDRSKDPKAREEGETIIKDGDTEFDELLEEVKSLQEKISDTNMPSGQVVSLSA